MVAGGRIPDLRNVLVRPRDAAIDGLIFLPEPPPGLESNLDGRDKLHRLDRGLGVRGEVVGNVLQDWGGDSTDRKVRIKGLGWLAVADYK